MYWLGYLLAIVAINVGFAYVPLINGWPPLSLAVGLVFVLRDFAQRQIGHRVISVMLVGAALSFVLASPVVAAASCAAYLVGEFADWALYSALPRQSLANRVLVSSIVSTPLDSAVFLHLIGALSLSGVLLMTASKLIAAFLVFGWLRKGEQHASRFD